MRSSPRVVLRVLSVVMLAVLASSCFLRLTVGRVADLGEFIEVRFENQSSAALCDAFFTDDPGTTILECEYFIPGETVGEVTSTAVLREELGVLGLVIDPIILQVPDSATNVVATFREDAGATRPVEITITDSFAAQPGTVIFAEAGQQFAILQLPADVADRLQAGDPRTGTSFDFALRFRVPDLAPVDVKPMFTLDVEVDGQTFYPPMLPCVTDFADVPSFRIPISDSMVDLQPAIRQAFRTGQDLACDGQVYDFRVADVLDVAVDIKPGSDPNAVNPDSRGVVPVAVLTTAVADGDAADFDATTIDLMTVAFGPSGAAEADGRGHVEDVDDDGDDDLVLHFRTADTGIHCGDTEASLTGKTIDGTAIAGSDAITTVACR